MTAVPYDWLKELSPELLTYDNVPLFGKAPSFPWEQFSKKLSETFEVESLKITPGELKWRTEKELEQDIGDKLRVQPLSAVSFAGELYWVMAEQDLVYLMTSLLTKKPATELEEFDEDFESGFARFLGVECINALSAVDFEKTLTPHLIDKDSHPQGPALCQDVQISLFDHIFTGRLVISSAFRTSWKEHYANTSTSVKVPADALGKITLPIHLEVGETFLSQEDIRRLQPGDLLLLDQFTLDGSGAAGKVLLTLHGRPLLGAELSKGSLTISESPIYKEVVTDMRIHDFKDQTPVSEPVIEKEEEEEEEEESEKDEFTFEDLDEEFDFDEETTEEGQEKRKGDKAPQPAKAQTAPKAPTPSAPAASSTSPPAKPEAPAAAAPSAPATPKASPAVDRGEKVNLAEAGMHVVIEIGRLQIPLQRLLELQKGNILELGITPESGVDLVVSGTCIGKGELVKIGDTLGIRILDIGA